jgi:hypothetical protein
MKKKVFFAGMGALLLSFGLILAGCGDKDRHLNFDDTTLAGTTWATTEDAPLAGRGTIDMTSTLKFTSNIAGTAEFRAAERFVVDIQKLEENLSRILEAFGHKSGAKGTYTVDAGKKYIRIASEDGETEPTTLKLKFVSPYNAVAKTGTYTLQSDGGGGVDSRSMSTGSISRQRQRKAKKRILSLISSNKTGVNGEG